MRTYWKQNPISDQGGGTALHHRHQSSMLDGTVDANGKFGPVQDAAARPGGNSGLLQCFMGMFHLIITFI